MLRHSKRTQKYSLIEPRQSKSPQIHLCIKVLINCASNSSNLPAFNGSYSRSDIVVLVFPLAHGHHSDLALSSKMLLALLNPLLDAEKLHALKLTREEAKCCVHFLSDAISTTSHLAYDFSLLTFLRMVSWFCHEYHKEEKKAYKHCSSEYEKHLITVSNELKSNAQLLVEEGILSILKSVLCSSLPEDVKSAASRLLWCLAHDMDIKARIMDDVDIVAALQDINSNPAHKLSLSSHCALFLLNSQATGRVESATYFACYCLYVWNYKSVN